ncbi:MAG: hypothetical protein EBS99_06510 [Betaproteobacteria bacterium]|nr:hypothetical protein [Betaproteobacteria bacterium]
MESSALAGPASGSDTDAPTAATPAAGSVAPSPDATGGEERRERRPRGERSARERRERPDRERNAEQAPLASDHAASTVALEPSASASGAATAINGSRAMPRVQPYELPMQSLQDIAVAAGLQWINSDADKVREVQDQIAREPKPVHVPRERAPVVLIDEGPLVLVETRRDLRDLRLPIDAASS